MLRVGKKEGEEEGEGEREFGDERGVLEEDIEGGGEGGQEEKEEEEEERRKGWPRRGDAAERKKWFLNKANAEKWVWEKGRTYMGDFFNPYLDFNSELFFSFFLPFFLPSLPVFLLPLASILRLLYHKQISVLKDLDVFSYQISRSSCPASRSLFWDISTATTSSGMSISLLLFLLLLPLPLPLLLFLLLLPLPLPLPSFLHQIPPARQIYSPKPPPPSLRAPILSTRANPQPVVYICIPHYLAPPQIRAQKQRDFRSLFCGCICAGVEGGSREGGGGGEEEEDWGWEEK